mmetsp:Transcript_16414/g.41858  ORF Transcript_16414/g.41858 Transcript_16414/m.41858 type:complete len:243 (-) Transcript_16414:1065-1793(-)
MSRSCSIAGASLQRCSAPNVKASAVVGAVARSPPEARGSPEAVVFRAPALSISVSWQRRSVKVPLPSTTSDVFLINCTTGSVPLFKSRLSTAPSPAAARGVSASPASRCASGRCEGDAWLKGRTPLPSALGSGISKAAGTAGSDTPELGAAALACTRSCQLRRSVVLMHPSPSRSRQRNHARNPSSLCPPSSTQLTKSAKSKTVIFPRPPLSGKTAPEKARSSTGSGRPHSTARARASARVT